MKTKKLPGGYIRLTPESEKILLNIFTGQEYSEAIVKEERANEFMDIYD